MIEFKLFFALISYYFVMFVTPGPNNAMVLTSGLKFGFNKTIPHMTGITIGHVLQLSLVCMGLGKIFQIFPQIQNILKTLKSDGIFISESHYLYDLIQQKKAEFAARMGFDLDQTAQAAADELEDKLVADGEEGEPKVEPAAQRMPHEPPPEEEAPGTPSSVEDEVPEAELEQQPTDEPTVEEEPEEDETNS